MEETGRSVGPLLLQGGAEMQAACRDMDEAFLRLAPHGPLVVLLGAATPGGDHDRAADRALAYYEPLLPGREVVVAPHPQRDLAGCVEAVSEAAVVVLPGGSPSRLLDCLLLDGGRLGGLLTSRHHDGAALSGSSAGAMVLCARTVLPDRHEGGRPAVADGLGLLPGLTLVHDDGSDRGWSDPTDPDGPRWGLPEAGGVLVRGTAVQGVGRGRARLLHRGSSRPVPLDATPVDALLLG